MLDWGEVKDGLTPRAYSIRTMLERLDAKPTDPLRVVLTEKPDLAAALARLADRV